MAIQNPRLPGKPSPQLTPDAVAQQYATQNNVSLEAAKTQLRSMCGEPNAAQAAHGPMGIARQYADKQNVSMAEAMAKMDAVLGKASSDNNFTSTLFSPGMKPSPHPAPRTQATAPAARPKRLRPTTRLHNKPLPAQTAASKSRYATLKITYFVRTITTRKAK